MNPKLSPALFDSISSLAKIAMSGEKNNEQLKIEYVYDILDTIFKEATKEVDKNFEQENFDEVAYVFMLISEVLTKIAPLFVNSNASAVLKEAGEQWLRRSDSMIRNVATLYNEQALISNMNAEFSKASEYKNKADNLTYDTRRRVANEVVEILKAAGNRIVDHSPEPSVSEKTDISYIVSTSTWTTVHNIISPEDIKIRNNSRSVPSRNGWYDWSVYLDVPDSLLNHIKSVTYTLHPTFPEPIIEVQDTTTRFKLRARSWGEFEIKADVHLDDGNIITKYHWLRLGSEPPS